MAFQGNAFQNNAFQEGQGTPLPREPYRVDRIVPVQVVDNYTWIQNGFAVLLGAVVQNPFPNEDWPNPQWPQARRQDQQSWYNLNLIGQDVLPNNQDQWPNPRLREPNRQDFQGWYTLSLIGKDVLPNGPGGQVQRDFPNPTLSIVRRPDWQQAFPLPLVGADFLPFRQTDWPDPTLGIVRRPDWQWSYNLNLIGQDVLAFRQPDWPNPRGPQRSIDLITDTWNLTATISPVGVLPLTAFAQYDWPNPKGYPPRQDWQYTFPLSLIGADLLPNGVGGANQFNWPNPTLAIVRRPDWQFAFPRPLVGADSLPFRQSDWPDPTLAIVRRPDWQWWYNLDLVGQDALPFRLSDWPNPKGWPPRQDWSQTGLSIITAPVQTLPLTTFSKYDWPNPRLREPNRPDQQSWYTLALIGKDVLPQNLKDWPNPTPAKVPFTKDWTFSFSLELIGKDFVPPQRFNYDWPNPRGPRAGITLSTWVWNGTLGFAPVSPYPFTTFATTDWPNPRRLPVSLNPGFGWFWVQSLTPPDYCAFQQDAFQRPSGDPSSGLYAAFQTCPAPPPVTPLPPPAKAMTSRMVTASGRGVPEAKTGQSQNQITSGKGRSDTEHDP